MLRASARPNPSAHPSAFFSTTERGASASTTFYFTYAPGLDTAPNSPHLLKLIFQVSQLALEILQSHFLKESIPALVFYKITKRQH